MTLEGHYALSIKRRASFGVHHKNLNEDRLYCQRRRCSPMTLDSGDISFMWIFAGVSWNGGIIQQWSNRKRVFSGFRMLRIPHLRKWDQHYNILLFSPLSPFHWPEHTWPWMTLNGLKGHFTLYVHCCERSMTNYLLLIYCRLFITRVTNTWPAEKSVKRSITNDLQSGYLMPYHLSTVSKHMTLNDLESPFCFRSLATVAVLGKILGGGGGLAPDHLGGNNG